MSLSRELIEALLISHSEIGTRRERVLANEVERQVLKRAELVKAMQRIVQVSGVDAAAVARGAIEADNR